MAKDDRFTVIVAVLVTLITAGAFLWSHWGSPAIMNRPNPVAITSVSVDEPAAPIPGPNQALEPLESVPAVFEVQPGSSGDVAQASNPAISPGDCSPATLEKLVHGWTAPELPVASEILVRRGHDGRMVIASGTHRRYKGLRQDIQDLDPSNIDSALLRLAGSSSSDEEFFRTALTKTIDAVLAVDLPEIEPDMVAGVNAWQFADTEYRSLSTAQKHLLLMGRDNARAVRTKLIKIRQHIGQPGGIDTYQPAIRTDPVVVAHSLPSEDPIDELIEP